MSLTVRTAKALRLSSSSYIPLRLAREPYTLHLGTCSLVQVLSCTIVHTISKNGTRKFLFEIRCFSCCSPLTYISVPQAGSIYHVHMDIAIYCTYGHVLFVQLCFLMFFLSLSTLLCASYVFFIPDNCSRVDCSRSNFSVENFFNVRSRTLTAQTN
jgi:hypothetical protein